MGTGPDWYLIKIVNYVKNFKIPLEPLSQLNFEKISIGIEKCSCSIFEGYQKVLSHIVYGWSLI